MSVLCNFVTYKDTQITINYSIHYNVNQKVHKLANLQANLWGIPKNIEKLVLERNKHCVYCGCDFGIERSKKKLWEHIINDIKITTLDNIVLCCIGCNVSKGNKELSTWFYSENSRKCGITSDTIAEVIKLALKL